MENIRNDRYTLQYITEIVQRGRIKPAKFKYYLKMPKDIYIDLRDNNVIQPENYFIEETCFFVDKGDHIYMHFLYQYMINDLHLRIMDYLLRKVAYNPIERGGTMF